MTKDEMMSTLRNAMNEVFQNDKIAFDAPLIKLCARLHLSDDISSYLLDLYSSGIQFGAIVAIQTLIDLGFLTTDETEN